MNKVLCIFIIIIFSNTSIANNHNVRIFGKGGADCSKYVQQYQLSSKEFFKWIDDKNRAFTQDEYILFKNFLTYMEWARGFASGNNVFNSDENGDIYDMPDMRILAIEFNDYCNQNPSEPFFYAVRKKLSKYKK